jgi:hypothetical protein
MIVRKSNQKGFASLNCGCRFTIGNRKTLRVLPVWLSDAVETDFGFDIEIYKT